MAQYKTYICGDSPCPVDDEFEHQFYFGCVPKDFKERTGTSKTHGQTWDEAKQKYQWDGGCDAKR